MLHVGNNQTLEALRLELSRLGEKSGGILGVSAIHLETDTRVSIRGDEGFPMASTYKVPVAVALLQQVDEGKRQLTDMVGIRERDLVPSNGITAHFLHPGIQLSLHNLLEPMLIVSDNTATDVLMREVGGPEQINLTLKEMGVLGIRLDRNTDDLIRSYFEIEAPEAEPQQSLWSVYESMSEEEKSAWDTFRSETFADDARDTASPDAMAELLDAIWEGDVLSKKSTATIQDIMLRCETGEGRLKGVLPIDTPVAHKTGTIGGTSNDVGVITLPHGKGDLAIAVFIKKSTSNDHDARDRVIADVARAAHDYFAFNIAVR